MEMGSEHWLIVIAIGAMTAMILARLDRLGKQLEAVSALVRSDLAHSGEERDEIIREWKDNKQQAARDARHFWTFWGIVGAAALGWYLFTQFR